MIHTQEATSQNDRKRRRALPVKDNRYPEEIDEITSSAFARWWEADGKRVVAIFGDETRSIAFHAFRAGMDMFSGFPLNNEFRLPGGKS